MTPTFDRLDRALSIPFMPICLLAVLIAHGLRVWQERRARGRSLAVVPDRQARR